LPILLFLYLIFCCYCLCYFDLPSWRNNKDVYIYHKCIYTDYLCSCPIFSSIITSIFLVLLVNHTTDGQPHCILTGYRSTWWPTLIIAWKLYLFDVYIPAVSVVCYMAWVLRHTHQYILRTLYCRPFCLPLECYHYIILTRLASCLYGIIDLLVQVRCLLI